MGFHQLLGQSTQNYVNNNYNKKMKEATFHNKVLSIHVTVLL